MFRDDSTPLFSQTTKLIPGISGLLNASGINKKDKEHDGILGYLYDSIYNDTEYDPGNDYRNRYWWGLKKITLLS